jgi:hypothetical protein
MSFVRHGNKLSAGVNHPRTKHAHATIIGACGRKEEREKGEKEGEEGRRGRK